MEVEMDNACGDCTLCCKLLGVKELAKPKDTWCEHCTIGEGCSMYEDRPKDCEDFNCVWLKSQSMGESAMEAELRPDKTKVVLSTTTDGKHLVAYVDPDRPDAHKEGVMGLFIDAVRELDIVFVVCGDKRALLMGGPASPEPEETDEDD